MRRSRARARSSRAGSSARATSTGAFAAAAHVVRTDHVIPRLVATPMEPRGALAAPRRAPDGLVVVAERAPPARAARADPRPRRSRDPGDRPRRRRRLRLQGHAAGRDAAGRARRDRARPAGQVGRGPARELAVGAAGPRAARGGRARAGRRRPDPRRCAGGILADLGAYLLPSTAIPPHTTAMLLSGCYDIPSGRGVRHRRAHQPGADRALPRRRAARGDLPDRDDDRRRRARARDRPGRAAPSQPRARVPAPDRARLDLRLRRLRALPGHARSAAGCARRSRFARSSASRGLDGGAGRSERRRRCRGRHRRRRRAARRAAGVGVALCVERSGGLFEHATVTPRRRGFVVRVRLDAVRARATQTLFAQIAADRLGVEPGARDACGPATPTRSPTASAPSRSRTTVDGRLGGRRRGRRPAGGRPGRGALRVRPGLRLRRLRRGGRGRARDGRGARAAAGRGRRRGADRQPAAGRGPGRRRRGPGARRGADRGGRPATLRCSTTRC